MLEVEKRGAINQDKIKALREFLQTNGKLKSKLKQLNIFIEFDNAFLGTLENTKHSINVSFSKNIDTSEIVSKLKTKSGLMYSGVRNEISISFDYHNKSSIFDFLSVFGISKGCPRYYYREDYKFNNLNITLKEKGLAPDHFEIDMEIDSTENVTFAESQIKEFLEQHNLIAYSDEEYKRIMLKVFNENPPIPFSDISFEVLN